MDSNVMLPSAEDKSAYRCSDCGRGYHTVRDLVSHQGVHTGEYPYVCEYCHKGYKCKMSLVNHINLHTGEGYQCDKCKKVCGSAFLLKAHVRCHVKDKPVICKVCGKAFKAVDILRAHEKKAHSTKLYSCAQCKKKMTSEKTLQAHMKIHHLSTLACLYCKRAYKTRKSLQRHLLVHESTVEELLACPDCGARFLLPGRLRAHIERCHSQPKENNCIYCGICVDSEEALNDHIAEHRKMKPASCHYCGGLLLRRHAHKDWTLDIKTAVSCPRCTAQFHYPAELLEHAHVHGDDPAKLKWECDTCGRYFLCRKQYEKHMTRPHPLSPWAERSGFTCNDCFKPFINGPELKEHVKIHNDALNMCHYDACMYMCEDCGKTCSNLGSLNYHRRQHLNTDLFTCLYCPDAFKTVAHLRLHMKLHFGCADAYRCHPCDIQFSKKLSYILHLKFHCQNGDGVCMKCLVAFPTEELFAAHNRMHSLPYKCSKCREQFDNMELLKRHVEQGHCCTKVFMCGRCNLGLLSAEDLEQHEDIHVQEDASDAKRVKTKSLKNQELRKFPANNIPNLLIPVLNTYCTCLICNPSQCRYIDPKYVDAWTQNSVDNEISAATAPSARQTLSFLQNATINKINQALAALRVRKIPSSLNIKKAPLSPPVQAMPTSSKPQTLRNASVKKVVLTLPGKKKSLEAGVLSLPKTTPNSHQNCEGGVSDAVALHDNCSEQMVDPSKAVVSNPETYESTILPDLMECPNVACMKTEPLVPPPPDTPLLTLFCELLVQVLGQETVQKLSYAIMADVRAFLQSFLPSVEVNAMEITTEDTVWLFIQSMVQLFGEEKDELLVDYALNDLDSKSLVQEMLRCTDSNNLNN